MIPAFLWPVANHLWQSTAFAGVAALLTLALKKNHASVRYWLWFASSMKFLAPLSLLIGVGSHLQWRKPVSIEQPKLALAVDHVAQPFSEPIPSPRLLNVPPVPHPIPTTLLAVWLCGVLLSAFGYVRPWLRVRAAVCTALPCPTDFPGAGMRILAVRSSVELEPCVFGIIHPVLILPAGIGDHLTPKELEAVLRHELCHARRRDNLTASLHMLVEALFWFFPLVFWIGRKLVDERERACDEDVLRIGSEPEVYAQGILNVCKFYLQSSPISAAGVTGSDLARRIEAIMVNRSGNKLSFGKKLLLTAAGVFAALPLAISISNASLIRAQSQNASDVKFDVISVKRNNSGIQGNYFRPSEGRFSAENVSVQQILWWAYRIQDFQVVGAPGWIASEHYDIEAKVEGQTRSADMRLMVQKLLQDRFKLVLHRDTSELPIYVLTAAKSGLKLKAGTCMTREPNTPLAPGQRQSDFCGFGGIGNGTLRTTSTTMEIFTDLLTTVLKRQVVDTTGFKGNFDVSLRWTPDPVSTGNGGQIPTETTGPSIFTAMQEQLGLKLEAGKGPVDVLVVDHIERPSEN